MCEVVGIYVLLPVLVLIYALYFVCIRFLVL
jgi:hypothetical protein